MDEKVVKIINLSGKDRRRRLPWGDSSLRYEYIKPDGTKGTFGSVRKVFRCINEREEYGASTKFKVGLTIFAPGEAARFMFTRIRRNSAILSREAASSWTGMGISSGLTRRGTSNLSRPEHITEAFVPRMSQW